jgi:hypothetical protein
MHEGLNGYYMLAEDISKVGWILDRFRSITFPKEDDTRIRSYEEIGRLKNGDRKSQHHNGRRKSVIGFPYALFLATI